MLLHLLQQLQQMRPGELLLRSGRSVSRFFTRCQQQQQQQQQLRVLLVGPRFSGKTALVYRLKLGAFIPTKPSVGSYT